MVQKWLVEIPPAECEELLASSSLGRVGVVVQGRPEVFPVNHLYDPQTGSVTFSTMPGTKLHGALEWPWVAYEVDGVEADGAGGWSVMVVGRAEEITDPAEIGELAAERRVALWATGEGARWLRIVPTKVTGRRIRAVDRSRLTPS